MRIGAWGLAFAAGWLFAAHAAPSKPVGVPIGTPVEAQSLYLAHGDPEDGFFVPWSEDPKTTWRLVQWLFSPNEFDTSRPLEIPIVENDGAYLAGHAADPTITWVGHSTFAIHDGDDVILTDPHWGPRALIPGRESPPGIPLEAVPDDAFAVLSHNHYDHLDVDTVERLPASVRWFVPLGLADWFRERERPNVIELDWWESARFGRWTITCLPSQHWSRRIEQGTNESLWCTWLMASGERSYFFGGDTGYFHGFAEFGRRFGPIDVAMLPIGAYAPRWFMKWQHMDPEEAVQAHLDLGSRAMLGMHWGTFDLTDEPVDHPPVELANVIARTGVDSDRVRALAVGERWPVPSSTQPKPAPPVREARSRPRERE
ncbi:MAG: MBL fold metallo-hydrolase [Myxococcota bacterium]